jgi:hypothetical protein
MTGDDGRVGVEPFPTRRVRPPSKASSSSSIGTSPSERATVRTSGELLPSLKACRLACAFSRNLIMISYMYGRRLLSASFHTRKRTRPYQNFLRLESAGGLGEERTSRIELHKRGRSQTQGRTTSHNRPQDNLINQLHQRPINILISAYGHTAQENM